MWGWPPAHGGLHSAEIRPAWNNPLEDEWLITPTFDSSGQQILLKNELVQASRHEVHWHGKDQGGQALPSDTYFYRMETRGYDETKRMTLLK